MNNENPKLMLLLKLLICAIWLPTGVYQIFHFDNAVEQITNHFLPFPVAIAVLVILMKIGGTVLVLMDRWVKEVVIIWTIFVFVATPLFHYQMFEEGKLVTFHFVQTMKNLAIAGGLIAFLLLLLKKEDDDLS